MNAECRLLYKFQGGKFNPVFAIIFQYLPVFTVNTAGMENTHICRHFANLGVDPDQLASDLDLHCLPFSM